MLIGRDDEDARQAAKLATAVGIRKLGGYLAGGMTSWRAEHRDVARIERLRAQDLRGRREPSRRSRSSTSRERAEWDAGHIPGSVNMPYHDIREIPDGHRRRARPMAVICSSGQRSAVAASLLSRLGARQ